MKLFWVVCFGILFGVLLCVTHKAVFTTHEYDMKPMSQTATCAQLHSIHKYMSTFECGHVIQIVKPSMKVAKTGHTHTTSSARVSLATHISPHMLMVNHTLRKLRKRLKATFQQYISKHNVAVSGPIHDSMVDMQVVAYRPGGYFRKHIDALFVPGTCSMNSRVLSMFVYLSDGFSGGNTFFSELNILVTPHTGNAIIWKNVHTSISEHGVTTSSLCFDSIHEGTELRGQSSDGHTPVKWGLNAWLLQPIHMDS